MKGRKGGKEKRIIIYNVCDHAQCYKETGAQAVSYTTGVPPVVGAMMMFKGHWQGKGVFNVEQLPSKPFMAEIGKQGLPWVMKELKASDQKELLAVRM
jgi:saccharopine dehydrogenase (NAD+, L-lysine-forming)